jgi:hypothetical protein
VEKCEAVQQIRRWVFEIKLEAGTYSLQLQLCGNEK